jgi:hypothetical protein
MKLKSKQGIILLVFLGLTTSLLILFSILWSKGIIGSGNVSKGNADTKNKGGDYLKLEKNDNKNQVAQTGNKNQKSSVNQADKGHENGEGDKSSETETGQRSQESSVNQADKGHENGDKSPVTETKHKIPESSGSKADEDDATFSYKDIFEDGDPSTWAMRLKKLNDRYEAHLLENKDKIALFHIDLQKSLNSRNVLDFEEDVRTAINNPDADYQILIDSARLIANINFYNDLINYEIFQKENPNPSRTDLENFVFKSNKVKTHDHGFLLQVARFRISEKCPSSFIGIINNSNPKNDPNEFVSQVKAELSVSGATANSCRPLLMLSLYHHYFYVHCMNDPNFPIIERNSSKANSSKRNIEALEKVLGKVCKQI